MRGPFPYKQLIKYAHLSKYEAAIWHKFIELYPDFATRVWYDVELGETRENTEDLKREWDANKNYLGKYKIDVLCETDDFYTIIELKKEATSKALGEIWLYDSLFKKEWKPGKIVLNAIVTDVEMPNIREVAEADGVSLYVVGNVGEEEVEPVRENTGNDSTGNIESNETINKSDTGGDPQNTDTGMLAKESGNSPDNKTEEQST